jgi:hypothetical protein
MKKTIIDTIFFLSKVWDSIENGSDFLIGFMRGVKPIDFKEAVEPPP